MLACERISGSIVHCMFVAKDKIKLRTHIEILIDTLSVEESDEWTTKMNGELTAESETTTGFVVGETPDSILILTCAHSFQLYFNASHPISAKTLEGLYNISVQCDHSELRHRLNKHMARVYTNAKVSRVDPRKDLLLLKVRKGFCTENHPPLELAHNLPRCLGLVGMVSWPFDRHRTICKGNMSHNERGFDDISAGNPHGYNFTGAEVNISSEPGSSGAPLVDLANKVVRWKG